MSDIDKLDKRGTCSRCTRRRKIIGVWPHSGRQLCRECALTPGVAFAHSVEPRPQSVKDLLGSWSRGA